jgi:ATP-dependent DNA helicase RecG
MCPVHSVRDVPGSDPGQLAAHVLQSGFDAIQQEQMVLAYIEKHGNIKRADAAELCKIGPFQASRVLKRLVAMGSIAPRGKGKGTVYERRS